MENLVCIVINVKHANCWLTTGLLGDSYCEHGGAVRGENNTIVNSDNDCYAHLDRLPLPSRLLLTQPPLRISFPGKLVPREPLAKDAPHGDIKPLAIVQALPIIVPECLFVQVPEEVKRLHAHVGTMYTTLQEAPEVLQPVGVDFTAHVLDGMVYDFMLKFIKPFIRFQRIGEYGGTC